MRFLFGGDQRPSAAAVHDPDVHFRPGRDGHHHPLRTFPVIRDLVTDVSFNYEKARQIRLSRRRRTLPRRLSDGPGGRRAQPGVPATASKCFLCQNVCHVVRDHEENKKAFAGPRFLMRTAELDMHPLDTLDRRDMAQEEFGLGYCNITSAAPRCARNTSRSPTTP